MSGGSGQPSPQITGPTHADLGHMICESSRCDICTLGMLPGEERAAWIARLRDRFACNPLPEAPVTNAHYATVPYVCPRCGTPRALRQANCPGCAMLRTRAYGEASR